MIRKSGGRFSEKIMLKNGEDHAEAIDRRSVRRHRGIQRPRQRHPEFLCARCTHQENTQSAPHRPRRAGERERQVLASVAGVETTRLSPIFVEGDHSAIWWRFAFTGKDGSVRTMEEMALQTWRGDELIEERFFYDPKQMAVSK